MKCFSIVEKLNYHSLTGRKLGLGVHMHSSWGIHLCSNTGITGDSYRNCIVRSMLEFLDFQEMYENMNHFGLVVLCKLCFASKEGCHVKNGGVCTCSVKLAVERVLWLRRLQRERRCSCRWQVDFSLEITKRPGCHSYFLKSGSMILTRSTFVKLNDC